MTKWSKIEIKAWLEKPILIIPGPKLEHFANEVVLRGTKKGWSTIDDFNFLIR